LYAKRFKSAAKEHDSAKSNDGTFLISKTFIRAFSIVTNNLTATTKFRKHTHLRVFLLRTDSEFALYNIN